MGYILHNGRTSGRSGRNNDAPAPRTWKRDIQMGIRRRCAGVTCVAGGYRGSEVRLKRLYRMEAWSSVMFCAGAFFLFYGTAPRDWIAFTLAGGLIIVFTSWRIPREINKLQRNEGGKANK